MKFSFHTEACTIKVSFNSSWYMVMFIQTKTSPTSETPDFLLSGLLLLTFLNNWQRVFNMVVCFHRWYICNAYPNLNASSRLPPEPLPPEFHLLGRQELKRHDIQDEWYATQIYHLWKQKIWKTPILSTLYQEMRNVIKRRLLRRNSGVYEVGVRMCLS